MKPLLSCVLSAAALVAAAETISLKSPDGRNEIRLSTEPTLAYSVVRDGVVRVADSPIALNVEGRPLCGGAAKVKASDSRLVSGSFATPIYKKASVDLAGMEKTIDFEGGWSIVLHARNDGVAYRFKTAFDAPKVKVLDEVASLAFPSNGLVSYAGIARNGHQSSWESVYAKQTVGELRKAIGTDKIVYLPLLVQYPDGVNLVVTESDLLDYAGWNLRAGKAESTFESALARLPVMEKIENDQRHRRVKERHDYICETAGTRAYPWRVFILAPSAAKLCEADIPYALATPCALAGDLSWIKPGKVAWDWWNNWNVSGVKFRAGCNTKTYEYYIDFAKEQKVEYVIFDEGWSVKLKIMEINPEVDVPHLVKYANSRGVGIILWCSWPQLVGRQHEVFRKYAGLGVKGFKIDFMDRDDAFLVSYLEETARIAADYRLVIDYHGMYKPTGLSRTYPNILNYEGVHGLECMKWEKDTDFPANDLKAFFTRMTAGPMDYTPGAMINMTKQQFRPSYDLPGSQGTRVHQMALMSLYEAPLQMLCDSPTQYLRNQECFAFMAAVPTVWDETIGLAGDVDRYAVTARRKDDVWYVAAIGSWEPQEIKIDTAFLGEGPWKAEIFEDGINADRDATDYAHRRETITAGEKLTLRLAPGGGWTARFTKKTGWLW